MKGVKLCYGLLLACSIMLGLSLNVSLDVNALKHDVQYIPISTQEAVTSGTVSVGAYALRNSPFEIVWKNPSFAPSFSSKKEDHYFTSRILNNKCTFVNFDDHYYTLPNIDYYSSTYFSYSFPSYTYKYTDNQYISSLVNIPCMQNVPFGTILPSGSNLFEHPNFDDSSLVNIPLADRGPFQDLPPYYYDFDSFYLHDSAIDTNTGVSYSSSLKMSYLFNGEIPNKFSQLTIPLGRLNESVTGPMTSGRSMSYHGVFDFSGPGNYFSWNSNLDSSSFVKLYYTGLTQEESINGINYNESDSVECVTNLRSVAALDFIQLEFDCDFTASFTAYDSQAWFYIVFSSGDAQYLFDTNADWHFASAWFVTDNDDTPGGTWGYEPTGSHLENAPGSAQGMIPSGENFDLINLFNFNFINPFAPLFNMFQSNESCYSIPTIAGFIGAQSSQVCPWFSSDVRNVMTPVFTLLSSMLLFGFAVRWLGSRSGNFIEDSGDGFNAGSVHVGKKGGKK